MPSTVVVKRPAATHLPGCPVEAHPDDAALQARVESYRVPASGFRLNRDTNEPERAWQTVVHCCECGAMAYHKEP